MESDDNEYTIIINDLYIEQRIYRGYTCPVVIKKQPSSESTLICRNWGKFDLEVVDWLI